VQLEDKLVDGLEAAHIESRQREDMEDRGAEVLPEPVVEAIHDAALELRNQLLGAIRMILDRQTLTIASLHLPAREARALEALQVATSGRSTDLGQFVYASDRRDLLERALTVLQPDLLHADNHAARELAAQVGDLSERVADLRSELSDLEDAQDELLDGDQKAALEAGQAPPGPPKPKPPAVPSDPDAPRPATSLTGPELPPRAAPPTSLTGPELPPDRPAPTSLTGPELSPDRPAPTSLTGPELSPEAAPPTTLGDAGEIAAQAKKPWWRRPFG
jgi:hypothetical protein